MMAGLPYKSDVSEIKDKLRRAKCMLHEYNSLPYEDFERRREILDELLGKHGERIHIEQPFLCDYGCNIVCGENFYANHGLTVLDCNKVSFGDDVLIGPNVTISAAGHPVHPDCRKNYEYGIEISVGNRVWLGAGVIICPGVTIGDGSVIGAGSVVTHDIPANVVAFGNPCRVYRKITDDDKKFYYKDREFDVDDYIG